MMSLTLLKINGFLKTKPKHETKLLKLHLAYDSELLNNIFIILKSLVITWTEQLPKKFSHLQQTVESTKANKF